MEAKVSKLKWIGAVVWIIVTSAFETADSIEGVSVKMLSGHRFEIEARNPLKMDMSVELLKSQSGEIVYSEDIAKTGLYQKLYNLSNLEEGGYTLKYTIDNRIYEKEILLQDSGIQLLAETNYLTPAFYQDHNKGLSVTVFNPKKEDVSITFWKGAERFFTDKPGNFSSFKRQYHLGNLDPGEYDVNVNAGSETYSYRLMVK